MILYVSKILQDRYDILLASFWSSRVACRFIIIQQTRKNVHNLIFI